MMELSGYELPEVYCLIMPFVKEVSLYGMGFIIVYFK